MTTDELIALSKRVAEKLGIEPNSGDIELDLGGNPYYVLGKWLYEDSGRCFDLLGEYDLGFEHWSEEGYCHAYNSMTYVQEEYADHNNDRNLAARVAILRALEAM